MNKIVIAIIAIVVVAAGAFFFLRSGSSETNQTQDTSEMVNESGNMVSGTFMDLLALGQNYQCTFQTVDGDGNETSGVVYTANGGELLRGEFQINSTDGSFYDAHILRDGTYNYLWSSQQAQGFKTEISATEGLFGSDNESEGETDYGIDDNATVDFDCDSWRVDNSMFVPPSNIEFADFTQMMTEVQESLEQSGLDCSICDQVPAGDARSQCLSSLGC